MDKKTSFFKKYKRFIIAASLIVIVAIVAGIFFINNNKDSSDVSVSSESYTIEPTNVSVSDVFKDISEETGLSRDLVITALLSLIVAITLPILFIILKPRHNFDSKPVYNQQFMSQKPSGYLEEIKNLEMKKKAELKKEEDVITLQ